MTSKNFPEYGNSFESPFLVRECKAYLEAVGMVLDQEKISPVTVL